jgi:hypothetical protein
MRFGEVCDVSVLSDRESFERARELVRGGELYLPSTTYSWLSRDKLISVRNHAIGYSLVNQFVRDGQLLVVYLPEILDELSRRLLFEVEREVPLTDLRALMLAAHLKVPLLSFEEEPLKRLRERLGAKVLQRTEISGDWRGFKEALNNYRKLAVDVGNSVHECLNNSGSFDELVKGWDGKEWNVGKNHGTNPELEFEYVAWDLIPVLREYLNERVLQPEIVHELCERTLLLIARPR